MPGRTITRADLSEAVCQKVGLSRTDASELVEAMLDEISDALARGETVKISSFGTFVVREKSERVGRNLRTGEPAVIEPRRILNFRASHVLKNRMNRIPSTMADGEE